MKYWFCYLVLFISTCARVVGAQTLDPHTNPYTYDRFREMVRGEFCTGRECGPYICTITYNDSSEIVLEFRFNPEDIRIFNTNTDEILIDQGWRNEVTTLIKRRGNNGSIVTTDMSATELSSANVFFQELTFMIMQCLAENEMRERGVVRGGSA